MKTYVYVDGFNFYYGAVKNRPHFKWVDFKALSGCLLRPYNTIERIKYFTALVHNTATDPDKKNRQEAFIQATETYIPEAEIYYGFFLIKQKRGRLVHPISQQRNGLFYNVEEKGSDVNLAVHLYRDATLGLYDCALVLSNDGDLKEALKLVKRDFPQKKIGVVNPSTKRLSRGLQPHADFVQRIRPWMLARSQLPDPIPGTNIRKPATW